ncbi:hypothetical protein ACVMAJ_006925 [Bradyrhizobium sp. USDA 4448]
MSVLTRAAVGGVLFGGVGAIVGAAGAGSRSISKEIPSNITLRVISEKGTFSILFWKHSGDASHSTAGAASRATQEADKCYGWVLKAIRMAATNKSTSIEPALKSVPSPMLAKQADAVVTGPASELERLWQLKEKGAISHDEYTQAKQSLLNRS